MDDPADIPVYDLDEILQMSDDFVPVFNDEFDDLSLDLEIPGVDARGEIALSLARRGKLRYPEGINPSNVEQLIVVTNPDNLERTKLTLTRSGFPAEDSRTKIMQQYQILENLTQDIPEEPEPEPEPEIVDPADIPVYKLQEILGMPVEWIPVFVDKLGIRITGIDTRIGEMIVPEGDNVGHITIALALLNKLEYPVGIDSSNIEMLVAETDPCCDEAARTLIRKFGMEPAAGRYQLILQYLGALSLERSSPREEYPGYLGDISWTFSLEQIFIMSPEQLDSLKSSPTETIENVILRLLAEGRLQLYHPVTSELLPNLLVASRPENLGTTLEYVRTWLYPGSSILAESYKYYKGRGGERLELINVTAEAVRRYMIIAGSVIPNFNYDIWGFFGGSNLQKLQELGIRHRNYESVRMNAAAILSSGILDPIQTQVFQIWIKSGTPQS